MGVEQMKNLSQKDTVIWKFLCTMISLSYLVVAFILLNSNAHASGSVKDAPTIIYNHTGYPITAKYKSTHVTVEQGDKHDNYIDYRNDEGGYYFMASIYTYQENDTGRLEPYQHFKITWKRFKSDLGDHSYNTGDFTIQNLTTGETLNHTTYKNSLFSHCYIFDKNDVCIRTAIDWDFDASRRVINMHGFFDVTIE